MEEDLQLLDVSFFAFVFHIHEKNIFRQIRLALSAKCEVWNLIF